MSGNDWQGELTKILSGYVDGVTEEMETVMVKNANAGRKELRANSPKKTGHYKRGWGYKKTKAKVKGGGTVKITIYNQTRGQLTHLLEKGHVNRDGSRTPGRSHIAPVNDTIIEKVVADLLEVLEE